MNEQSGESEEEEVMGEGIGEIVTIWMCVVLQNNNVNC